MFTEGKTDILFFYFLSLAPSHQKVELTPTVAVANSGKGSRANEMATPALTAQMGTACSIVHVLEWKEGMAILPSSNLKVKHYFNRTLQ